MFQINNITTNPFQNFTLILPDQSTLTMSIYFEPRQLGWFITTLTYGTFTLNSLRITNQANMLRQFKNYIPFGMSCYSNNDNEPTQIQSFSDASSNLYILTYDEVQAYEDFLSGS